MTVLVMEECVLWLLLFFVVLRKTVTRLFRHKNLVDKWDISVPPFSIARPRCNRDERHVYSPVATTMSLFHRLRTDTSKWCSLRVVSAMWAKSDRHLRYYVSEAVTWTMQTPLLLPSRLYMRATRRMMIPRW